MRYRLFGEHTGLRVSESALGTANFGSRWGTEQISTPRARLTLAPHHIEILDRASALSPIFTQSMIDAPAYRQAAAGGQYDRVVMPETPAS